MYCIKCGKSIPEQSIVCPFCSASQTLGECSDVSSVWLPNNNMALLAYYLGIASLLCGLLTGVAAVITGIKGLAFARINPDAKGKVHAWVGILLGTFCSLCQILLAVIIIIGIFFRQ